MRWTVLAAAAYVALVLDVSVRNTLRLDSLHGISPSFVACLLTFVLLFAQRLAALWACWIVGALIDLLPSGSSSDVHVIGPHALGFMFGGMVIIPLRTMVFRRRSLTLGAMTMLFGLASGVAIVAVEAVRHWLVAGGEQQWRALRELSFLSLSALLQKRPETAEHPPQGTILPSNTHASL